MWRLPMKSILVAREKRCNMGNCFSRPEDSIASKRIRVTKIAVNMLAVNPRISVVANPRIDPVPNQ